MDAMAISSNPMGNKIEESLRGLLFIWRWVHGQRAGGAMTGMMLNMLGMSNILLILVES
jgi:hypothetical protein